MPRSVMWFRRDLRLGDNPALNEATAGGRDVVALFVLDPALWDQAGQQRRDYLARSLDALDRSIGGCLLVRVGQPADVVASIATSYEADQVHISADFGPYGRRRDTDVEEALSNAGVRLMTTGSPYAVAPGRVTKPDGEPYRVYTPFYRAWCAHGWRSSPDTVDVNWCEPLTPSQRPPTEPGVHPAGEHAASQRWQRFLESGNLDGYDTFRDRPDLDATSRMSVHLKFGEIHPRTMLAHLGDSAAHERFRKELAWREFYADVLWHNPESARQYLRSEFASMTYDVGAPARDRLNAWQLGRTGYPIVDAGMRQLLAEGWMHNRVRMIVASFLVKDLHIEWQHGARWFMRQLIDGDLASNAHGWQWTAGCGTDAAPYFRIFNPVLQGLRFDPQGDYVRRYVDELRDTDGPAVHQPWLLAHGEPNGYPNRIVDHDVERKEALQRYSELRG